MPTITWTLPDPLNNKSKTLSIYVTELQTAVNIRRIELGLVPLTFIDQSVGKKFRLDAVEELKTVTNDLAILYGYSAGVEDPALLGRPFVTITKKYGKCVCHYPILNDLRRVLNLLETAVLLYMDYVLNYANPAEDRNLANLYILQTPTVKSLAKSQFIYNARCRVCCDTKYVYRAYPSGAGDTFIYKENINTGVPIAGAHILNFTARDVCVDDQYVYITGYTGVGYYVKRLNKLDLSGLLTLITIDAAGTTYAFTQGSPSIICDANYLYITGAKKELGIGAPWFTLFNPHGVILRYSKSGGSPSEFLYRENYVLPQPPGPNGTQLYAITIDSEYIYVNYYERNYPLAGPPYQEARRILKIQISSMMIVANWIAGTFGDGRTSLTMSSSYIYELSRASLWGKPGVGLFTSYNKNGVILTQSNYVSSYYLNDDNMDNRMACKDEYLAGF